MARRELKIHIRLAPHVGYRSWKAEAEPLQANSGGGTYVLKGFSGFLPISPGDVIRAELGSDSALWMTELVEVAPHTVSMVAPLPGTPQTWLQAVSELFAKEGCTSHEVWPNIFTRWPEGRSGDDVLAFIHDNVDDILNAVAIEPEERRQEILHSAMLDRIWLQGVSEEASPTGYWVKDDPNWEALGVTDPGVLASLQSLADSNRRVLATIKAEKHENVLHYLHRLTTNDPSSLPPLDGPLLVNPDKD